MKFYKAEVYGEMAALVSEQCINSANGRVTIPNYANGYPVRNISNAAFRNISGLTELIIPSTVNAPPIFSTTSINNPPMGHINHPQKSYRVYKNTLHPVHPMHPEYICKE